KNKGEEAGFIIKGLDYAAIKFITTKEGCFMRFVKCQNAMKGGKEVTETEVPMTLIEQEKPYTQRYAVDDIPQPRHATQDIYVRAVVKSAGIGNGITSSAQFYYSLDGKKFEKLGSPFTVKEGKWIGAKVGYFNCRSSVSNDAAFLDIDWIKFTK
ncbi:MAG: glycoside hydrolase, partial [Prevotella sp.]